MRRHAAEAQVQAAGCSALVGRLLGDTQASKQTQLAVEAIRTVVSAKTAHASDGDVQCKACDALSVPQTLPNPACPGLPWVGPGSPCVGPVLPLCCAPWTALGHSWVSLGHSCVAPVLQHHVFPVFSAKAPDTFVVAAATT
jgi:hypothetical protein